MKVVVHTGTPDSPAHRALAMEGVAHTEIVGSAPFDYGNCVADLWNAGEPFVLIEWDIIPWPGAVHLLTECSASRCSHRYPLHRGNVCLSFGIGKYRPEGQAPEEWRTTPWQALDGQVVPVLNQRLGPVHLHEPPVAHARPILAT